MTTQEKNANNIVKLKTVSEMKVVKHTSMRNVANLANVSVTTISRVIRNDPHVSPHTREKVLRAVKKLNYYVNEGARSIIKKRTKTVGLGIFDVSNPFFPPLVRGVENTLNKFGYSLVLYNTDENHKKEEEFLRWMLEKRADGIILAPTGDSNKYLNDIVKRNIPLVFVDREVWEISTDVVCVDNTDGAFAGVEHLIKLGHRRIGMVACQRGVSTTEERIKGYLRALDVYGIEADETLLVESKTSSESIIEATKKLLSILDPPTAIFSGSNLVTLGILKVLKKLRKKIPQDLALVGFDDVEWGELLSPPLTAIRQPAYTIGATAAQILLQRLFEEGPEEKQKVVLKTNLVIRESCGAQLSSDHCQLEE